MEPVPEPWEAQRDSNDLILYYNTETGEETHQHPCDEGYRLLYKQKRAELLKERGLEEVYDSEEGENPDKSVNDGQQEEPLVDSMSGVDQSEHMIHPTNIMKSGKSHGKGVNQVTFFPGRIDGVHHPPVNYDDELQHADIAISNNMNSQNQGHFGTSNQLDKNSILHSSQNPIDPFQQYPQYYMPNNNNNLQKMRPIVGVPMPHYMIGQQIQPYRSAQYGIGPFMSHGQLSEWSSFHQQQKSEKATAFEKANNAKGLELKIIKKTLKRTKKEQIDEIVNSFKWELQTLRQEMTGDAEGRIAE